MKRTVTNISEGKKRHGGKRPGAGRKIGSGPYGERTTVMRVPKSRVDEIKLMLKQLSDVPQPGKKVIKVDQIFRPKIGNETSLKLYTTHVPAGLPERMEEYTEDSLDLNEHLLKNPNSTFFVRVSGDSMIDAGIHPGDLLVVDRSLPPSSGRIVVAVINGESTVKRLVREHGKLLLMPENPTYPAIEVRDETMFMIWGVVTNVIHSL